MKFKKKEIKIKNKDFVQQMCEKFQVSPIIMELLFARGYTTESALRSFLQPSITQLYNPFLLKNMQEAVSCIKKHVQANHHITILGDYDTDGICATAILEKFLQSKGAKVSHFLPNRFVDGYGMTKDTIDKIIDLYQPDLIVTVDCGISCYQEIAYAQSHGIEVVVTDHHELPDILPDCVVVDPKIQSSYPFTGLCGAGVVLKLVHAYGGIKECLKYTPICALATVADIVPLNDENRIIVVDGLSKQDQLPKGVLALVKKLKLKSITSTDISMKIAPKINTAGRMGDPSIAYQLFVENDDKVVQDKIKELFNLNNQRVQDGNDIYEECLSILEKENIANLHAIVLKGDHWNSGVLGIICSRLVERYQKPVFLMAKVDNELKGSVRSIEGIDISKLMNELKEEFIRFGGHSQAGGYSIYPDHFDRVKERINEALANFSVPIHLVTYYDADLDCQNIHKDLLVDLQKLEPFGFGNEKPTFKININDTMFSPLKNFPNYIKGKKGEVEFICYQGGKYLTQLSSNCDKNIIGELGINTFGSKNTLQVTIKDFDFGPIRTDVSHEFKYANYIDQLKYLPYKPNFQALEVSMEDMVTYYNQAADQGVLVITNEFEHYQTFIKQIQKPIEYAYQEPLTQVGNNTIVFLPRPDMESKNYQTLLLLDSPFIPQYLSKYNQFKKVLYLKGSISQNIFHYLTTDRMVFAYTHQALKQAEEENYTFDNLYDLYKKVKKVLPQFKNYKYHQFYFILCVFEELSFILIQDHRIHLLPSEKKSLDRSSIYQFIQKCLQK